MRAGVLVYPGSNCDRDMKVALEQAGFQVDMIWHKDTSLPSGLDLVAVPGGFSFGDYLRCGAIAAQSPITQGLISFAQSGGYVLGVCNGFQVLTETKLLPGALMRNAGLKFICKSVDLRVSTTASAFTEAYKQDQVISVPVAHHDGNYSIDADGLTQLQDEDRIAFRYMDDINGSVDRIAGVLSENRRVMGMMPHPERAISDQIGGAEGQPVFAGLLAQFIAA